MRHQPAALRSFFSVSPLTASVLPSFGQSRNHGLVCALAPINERR